MIQHEAFVAIAIVPLVLIYFILSLLKASLRSLTRVSVRRLAASATRHQLFLGRYLKSPGDSILHVQTLIQMSLVAIAVLMTHAMLTTGVRWPLSVSVATLCFGVLVLEHFFPRLVQSRDRERLLLRLLPAFELLEPVMRNLTRPLSLAFRTVLPESEDNGSAEVSDEDVRAFIDVGEEEGILGEDQGELLESLVDFGDTIVREVMTPRVDMVSIEAQSTIAEARDLIIEAKHSRIPVFRERVDNVEGIADIRVLLEAWRGGHEQDPISKWVRPTRFVPETKKVSSLLTEFQQERVTLAVVVDEYGGISGLVTVEDLVEELVGEITEEHEDEPSIVTREADGSYLFSGKVDLETLEETVGCQIEEGAYDTLAGLVFSTLGRIPEVGEQFERDALRFQVVDADRRRVNTVRVSLVAVASEGEPGEPLTA